jgi:hypothetical protein
MKKVLPISLIALLILMAVNQIYAVAENIKLPIWFSELHVKINQTFQLHAKSSSVKEPDGIEQDESFSFCLKGNGSLEKVPEPFQKMDKLFLSDGWKPNERYQADGHGSSSFAYEKEKYLCLISVTIDSSCDDEEQGHVPSEFWFEIYCREKFKNKAEKFKERK